MKKWLKRIGIGLGVLVGLLVVAGATVWAIGTSRFNQQYAIGDHPLPPPDDSSMARGQYLVTTRGCAGCHGANLGGQMLVESPAFAILPAPNLTRGKGGAAAVYTDTDWERAIRHGVSRDGRTLLIMPSQDFSDMSDADVRAIVTYIEAQPPVETTLAERKIGPIARIVAGTSSEFPLAARLIDHTATPSAPREEVSVAYGEYVARMCKGCHGSALQGSGDGAEATPPLDATGHLPKWTEEQFLTTLRTGITPEGKQLDPQRMPWRVFGAMRDTELKAVWMYLRSTYGTAASTS